ncbi:MAG TPA: hypothetical protein VHD36_14820 [Pirellulales bacterium]|nr:hypothetical protein [Pirellulales bacterium]
MKCNARTGYIADYRSAIGGCLVALIISTPSHSQDGQQAAPSSTLKLVLRSLPSTTESLIVLGPYKPHPPTRPEPIGHAADGSPYFAADAQLKDVTTEWEAYRCNRVFTSMDRRVESYCETHEIDLSVFSFRALRTEFAIPGGTSIEACQIVVFKDRLENSIEDLFENPLAEIAGTDVIEIFEKTVPVGGPNQPAVVGPVQPPPKRDRMFLAIPYDRMLVASNSWAVLTHVLKSLRATSVPDNGLRATRDAGHTRLWGVRRFGPSFARDGTAAVVQRDPGAKRLEMAYEAATDSVVLRYISSARDSEATLQTFFQSIGQKVPPVRRRDAETVELTLREPAREWILVFAVLGMLVLP